MATAIDICRKYRPLFSDDGPRYVIVTGGRGSGKSFALSMALSLSIRSPGRKILFTRYTMISARDSIIPEFLEKLDRLGISNEVETSQARIIHRSGSEILFRGIKTSEGVQTAKLKSIQGVNAWVLDEAEELPDEDTFDKIDLSVRDTRKKNKIILCLNPVHKSHWIYNRFFNETRQDTCYIHTDYRDNAPNLPPDYLERAEDCRMSNERKYRHVWLGEWLEEAEGALWTWAMIQPNRVRPDDVPPMRRVVVAVDPAATSSDSSDETGIVCVGLGTDGYYYVLSDLTMRGTPMAWAGMAVAEYRNRKADRIVAETNNGGEMVEATLRAIDPSVSYLAVHASRGKMVRAEPVAALYERGMVRHVGQFRDLEAELLTYAGKDGQRSPNRMDALVWAMTSLMESGPARTFEIY
jgi:phage terminase large subunit-like protein